MVAPNFYTRLEYPDKIFSMFRREVKERGFIEGAGPEAERLCEVYVKGGRDSFSVIVYRQVAARASAKHADDRRRRASRASRVSRRGAGRQGWYSRHDTLDSRELSRRNDERRLAALCEMQNSSRYG